MSAAKFPSKAGQVARMETLEGPIDPIEIAAYRGNLASILTVKTAKFGVHFGCANIKMGVNFCL